MKVTLIETLSTFLVALFFGNQQIRIQHLLKVNCLSFFFNFNHYLKSVDQKTFEVPSGTLHKKNPIVFLFDDIDVDCFFSPFLVVFFVKNRVIRLSKGLLRKTYSI